MWKEIVSFELAYRKKRPATYLYFAILFLMGFLMVSTSAIEMFGAGGQLKENGSLVMLKLHTTISLLSIFIISAVMGVPIIRDFEHRTEALFFTTNLSKFDYLFGRFIGSLIVLLYISSGIPLGIILGDIMPWRDHSRMLSFNLLPYLYNYVILILPNIVIMASIFFTVGALSRKMIVVFMQGVIFLLLYLFTGSLLSQVDKREIAAFLDPLGIRAAGLQSLYWSIAQNNHSLLSLTGVFLYNRLFWLCFGIVCLGITYCLFSFQQILNPIIKKKSNIIKSRPELLNEVIPTVSRKFNHYFLQIFELTKIYYQGIVKDLPFIGLTICGFLIFIFNSTTLKGWYGTTVIPSTSKMLESMGIVTTIFSGILSIMYIGDLVWKERELRMNLIHDALPISNIIVTIGKLVALILAICSILVVAILISIVIQTLKGFHDYQLLVYIKSLFGGTLPSLIITMLLGFFVHSLVNNKFLGHGIMILTLILTELLYSWGVEHSLLLFDSALLDSYSDMNGFGHFVPTFIGVTSYWAAFSACLFAVGALIAVRGSEEILKLRLKVGKSQLNKSMLTFFIFTLLVFIASGAYVYYNTNYLNRYTNSKTREQEAAMYEKTLKKYQHVAQPKITDIKLSVDLMPQSRDFVAKGYYWLKNKTNKPITNLYVMAGVYDNMKVNYLKLNTENQLNTQFVKDFSFYIYQLKKPLLPADSLKMDFSIAFQTAGYSGRKNETDVVYNGTFLNNSYFPTIGYSDSFELQDDDKRKEQGLKERPRALDRNNPVGLSRNVYGDDADFINFDITLSTSPEQIAIAPGYLQKEWTANGKRYFHYVMDTPIDNFYSIVSAKYAVQKEIYKGVSLEIYYHPTHTYNIERLRKSMKASLDYYQTNFGQYQYRQLRIMEVPRYHGFAQSFANTVPFGETMGFAMDIDDKKDIDMPFFVTAHEIAHQWWGHQAREADVKGAGFLSESLAEYSALMTMNKHTSKEQMQKFLEFELDYYLKGRANERKNEEPLSTCANQQYIHYNKGSLVLYSIQDYIGEARLNSAIKKYLQKWNWQVVQRTGIYPNSNDLIKEIKAVTPDSLQYLVTDFIESIVLYDNQVVKADVKKANGGYNVNITLSCGKIKTDGLGNENPMKMDEWIWVGVYGKADKDDNSKLIYYKRHRINQAKQQISISVKEHPEKVGIDPLHLLIDRQTRDNILTVEL